MSNAQIFTLAREYKHGAISETNIYANRYNVFKVTTKAYFAQSSPMNVWVDWAFTCACAHNERIYFSFRFARNQFKSSIYSQTYLLHWDTVSVGFLAIRSSSIYRVGLYIHAERVCTSTKKIIAYVCDGDISENDLVAQNTTHQNCSAISQNGSQLPDISYFSMWAMRLYGDAHSRRWTTKEEREREKKHVIA